jgi:tetratricopeptide (TPR) repeat protein
MDDQMDVIMEERNEKQNLLSRLPERRKVSAIAIVVVALLGLLLVNQNWLGSGTDADSQGNLEQLDGFDAEIDAAVGLITAGNSSDAEVVLRKILSEAPNHALANFNLGVIAQFDNRLDDAINHYSIALVGAPMFKSALYNRGLANRDVGNIEQAIADLNTVIANYPDSASAAYNLGNILIEKGDQETGNAYIARALKLDPTLGG